MSGATLTRIALADGDVALAPHFLPRPEADSIFAELREAIAWEQHHVRIGARRVPCPRLSCWIGDPEARYAYSGHRYEPRPWSSTTETLRKRIEGALGCRFNSVLANLYRDGRDSMGWHSDDEPELGAAPTIASLSLGAVRRFRLRHRSRAELAPVALELPHGSLLVMRGSTQDSWRHQVPKALRVTSPRLNLTFRWIDHASGEEASSTRSASR